MKALQSYLLLAATILIASSASALSFTKSDKDAAELKGPVKMVKEFSLLKNDYFDVDTITKYERLGKPLPEYNRSLIHATVYDRQGRLQEELDQVFERYKVCNYSQTLSTAMMPEITDTYDSSNGKLVRHYSIQLDTRGVPVYATAVDENNEIIFTEEYSASVIDGVVNYKCVHSNYDGTYSTQTFILRDDLSFSSLTTDNGSKKTTFILNTDEKPLEIVTESLYSTSRQTITYYPDQTVTTYTDDTNPMPQRIVSQLDSHGNTVTKSTYDSEGNLTDQITYQYTYDNYGNWIKRYKYQNGSDVPRILEREITYY